MAASLKFLAFHKRLAKTVKPIKGDNFHLIIPGFWTCRTIRLNRGRTSGNEHGAGHVMQLDFAHTRAGDPLCDRLHAGCQGFCAHAVTNLDLRGENRLETIATWSKYCEGMAGSH